MISRTILHPLLTIGSGGSFSTASYAADLHQRRTGQLARAATPLETIDIDFPCAATLCFSASGRNRDIGVAFKLAAQHEPGPVGALVLSQNTPLHSLQNRYRYTDVVGLPHDSFKDGFLAVASMIGSAILLNRAYDSVFGQTELFPDSLHQFTEETFGAKSFTALSDRVEPVISRSVTSLLFSPLLRAGAVDLESRFVEAALGSIHIADFRNFGHGRHHWIAKRSDETGVIALASNRDDVLCGRTLSFIPHDVPKARIDLQGPPDLQTVAALFCSLYISASAGRARGIDPGRPGVPAFGRKLYSLGPGALKRKTSAENERAAIRRKAPDALKNEQQTQVWRSAYAEAVNNINHANIGGIVFDYDGTLCDDRNRYEPLSLDIANALKRLHDMGLAIGIATGRGASAGAALRHCLPAEMFEDVVIGYYNGAVVTKLENENDQLIGEFEDQDLLSAMRAHPVLAPAEIRSNAAQISLRLPPQVGTSSAISAVDAVLSEYGFNARITASSHSIDVQFFEGSKCAVVTELTHTIPNDTVLLRIGDKGVWPGNDADLLDSPYGLSVDEASRHLQHCWALAPAGIKGVQATLYYLSVLKLKGRFGQLHIMPGHRGDLNAA